MVNRRSFGVPAGRVVGLWCAALALCAALLVPAAAHAQAQKRVLLYTGTTGYRHTDGINGGRPVVQSALQTAGFTVDWEDCVNNGGGLATNCDDADKNPRIFTDANLAKYDAILLLNASSGPPGPLWSDAQKASIIKYVQNGGGIAGVHNATDMGTSQVSWNWWDGDNGNSVVGARMKGHGASSLTNVGQIQVADQNHLSTRDLPDQYGFGDEHYNFARNVRGSHHVLATIDERTYSPGNPMGQDHPLTWCKLYDGDNVNDNTGTNKSYNDGRTWVTSMGHFGASYTENGGNNNLIKQIVGGVRWVAGEGKKSDCSGTVWSSFTRQVLVADANNPIGIDVAKDGKVYWSEIGSTTGYQSQGYIKMHDPAKAAGNKTTVATILTRADHGNSEDGVLGMSLQPDFDLADANKRNVFVYYSPRNAAWPTSGNVQVVGHNQISRFTLNADGTAVVPDSERVILRVPKVKIAGNPSGFPGGPADSGPGHVGGAGLDFDSAGNLYLGVGDDVSPNASPHGGYAPMDHRSAERWDARKTSQNSADLRGKILRITPNLGTIAAGAEPALNTTYTVPTGNLFPVGTAKARPEIYAMGFRQPFTVHTDPGKPGTVATGEYCHDNNSDNATRSPAGICEWNLLNKAGNHGWPFCMGTNNAASSTTRWNYATATTTGQQYDCNAAQIPSDIRYAPAGQTPVEPTFDGLDTLPGPIEKATIFKKYGTGVSPDFGDLSAGGMQPITGPIYRSSAASGAGAFPPYYDGSWLINNRGAESGFWKEVQLRKDNNEMLRVNEWLPYNGGVNPSGANSGFVIGTQFGPDGNLYMARYQVGCCRSGTTEADKNQIVKISFNVLDQCDTDTAAPSTSAEVTGQAYPDTPNTYVNTAKLRLSATDSGCAGVKNLEYRQAGSTDWLPYSAEVTFDEGKTYNVEYRATDRKDNVAAVKTATFTVLKINDTTAPTATAATSGNKDQRGNFVGSATLTLSATDEAGGSGVHTIEYRVGGGAWTTYTAAVAFNAAGDYTVDYRATDKVNNTSAPKQLTFRILSGAGCTPTTPDTYTCETTAPITTATVDPAAPTTGDTYDRSVRITLAATDTGANASGVNSTEYRVITNGGTPGQWTPYADGVTLSSSGTHVVEYRSTDKAANAETAKTVTVKIQLPTCDRSDEFDGNALRGHWVRHVRNGGTPTTGDKALSVANGVLNLPTADQELDAGGAGPVNFIGQDLAALGNAWTAETQFTVQYNGGWQNIGIIVWNGDNNFFRSSVTHQLNGGSIFVEQSKDNPTSTEGARQQSGNTTILPNNTLPFTIRMRYTRTAGSDTVTSAYRIVAPASAATPDWMPFPTVTGNLNLNPAGGARRDAAGSRIGLIAEANFPGNTGTNPYTGTPAVAKVDYFRVTPDVCPDPAAPVTTATLDPAQPGAGGTYTGPVTLTLNATDEGSGVEKTEYQVTTSSPFGGLGQANLLNASEEAWVTYDAANKPRFTDVGNYSIEYRSTDKSGNVEAIKTIAFKIAPAVSDDTLAPTTIATLAPAAPGAGGTYEEPVTVTFGATDPAQPAPVGATAEVQPFGQVWTKPTVDLKNGDRITWTWPETEITAHDLRLRAPGAPTAPDQTEATKQLETLKQIAFGGDTPVSKTFAQNGAWTFICTLHSTYDSATNKWTGMVGTANVTGTAPTAPTTSGVDYTEYRVNGGAWTKGTTVTTSAIGAHTVDFRSTDKAGNVETAKSVAFTIKEKTVTPQPTVSPTPTPTPNTPAATPVPTATPAPPVKPSVRLAKPGKTTVAKFAKSGLQLRATCTGTMQGAATVTVSSKVRKALKLKSATLAKATVKCRAGTTNVTLKPTKAMQRALAKIKQSVKVTVTLTAKPAGQPATKTTLNVTLARK